MESQQKVESWKLQLIEKSRQEIIRMQREKLAQTVQHLLSKQK